MTKGNNLSQFGNRLKSARKMAALSMEELSQKAGGIVTKQAISKYENGKMNPSSEVLLALSEALGIKAEYFYRSTNINLSHLEFRKKSSLSAKIRESIKQKTIDFLDRYIQLEDILGIEKPFENPLHNRLINNLEEVEIAAREVRESWSLGLSPICNLLEILEDQGIKVYTVDNIHGFDGLSAKVGGFFILLINREVPADRMRFTAAHELAHMLCDFPEDSDSEKICHAFAGALLMPRPVIERELMKKREQISLWELEELKALYGISVQAIVKRAHILGIVSDFYFRNFQIMLSRKGWRKKEPTEYRGKEEAIRFKQLLHYTVSEEIITMSRGAELANISFLEFQDEVRSVI